MSQRTHSVLTQEEVKAALAEVRRLGNSGQHKEAAGLFDKHFYLDHPNPITKRGTSHG